MIHLHTLGEAVITVGNREVRPTSPTVFAALLYLSVERGQRVPRAALQGLLFPDADERSGSHSLRQLLYKLRQLGAPVRAQGDVVWIEPGDVTDAAGSGAPANGNGHTNGAFLSGYLPRISRPFDEWLEQQRAAIGKTVRRDLLGRMAARRSAADWAAVEAIAQQVLRVDAFNEEATFALAEATALSGAKAEALRILERYESEVGRSELKLPSSVLRRRISERLPERRPQKLDTPFVGREAETEAMRHAITQLRQGVQGTVVIVGEPGIGKSRLLEEMSALAMLEGVNVQTVRCQPHHANRPMGVFIELVPALLQCRGALGIDPEMLEHLELLTSHRDDRANRPTDARDAATRSGILLAAVRDLVDAVSAEAPLLIAIEDAHWADPTSLTELSALVQGTKSRSLLLVETARQLEPLKQAGVISDHATVLKLKPLLDDSMASLAEHLLPNSRTFERPSELRSWCVATAAGNPLYLQVLCAHYEETRQAFAVPPSMRAGIVRRIEQLPGDCRRLLEFSALLGRHASLDALRALLELAPISFLKAVQRVETEGFVKTRDGAVRLSHDLLAECTLELVPPLSRQALHACVAARLELRHEATGDAAVLWECAEHWGASGESAAALRLIMRCASHASHLGRAGRAGELLEGARKFCSTSEEDMIVTREAMLVSKAAGAWDAVDSQARNLVRLREAVGHAMDVESELIAVECRWFADFSATSSLPRLLEIVDSGSSKAADRLDAAYLAIRIANETGDAGAAKSVFERVAPMLRPDSRRFLDRLLPVVYHTSFGDRECALSLARALRSDLAEFEPACRMRLASNTGLALGLMGAFTEARAVFQDYYRRAVGLDLRVWSSEFAIRCAWTEISTDDYDGARRWHKIAHDHGASELAQNYRYGSNAAELAIHARDIGALRAAIKFFPDPDLTVCPARVRAFRRSLEAQCLLLEPSSQVSDEMVAELSEHYNKVKLLIGADGIAEALCLALERKGRRQEAEHLAEEYVTTYRRELSPLTAGLRTFVRRTEPGALSLPRRA